ncbi:HAD family hydrolase [Singulisphaera sp. PoT]|uniref:HAD family hydrolase n=1 Tax=Singulisphaera sp. PoT TaxID=3411797 RepID=UPI003BF5C208
MKYKALATDYDGTLAERGAVSEATLSALSLFQKSGRKLILITGRELDELLKVFPSIAIFDLVVAENGALLYDPRTKDIQLLGEAPPQVLLDRLRAAGVQSLSPGRVIVATWRPYDSVVAQIIADLGLDLCVILNKRAVMILPHGINKASGLNAGLVRLELKAGEVAGIGDAENDLDFLQVCGYSAAVANALPPVKEQCDVVMLHNHGTGVEELIQKLLSHDA